MEKDVDKLLARAKKPLEIAPALHQLYRGKIEITPRCRVRDLHDFDVWYTPGVAAPCREIQKEEDLVYEYTSKWNTVAVVSDGTRVLGLGDIGPEAAMPVMEGKGLLFKYLGGVDAWPLCIGPNLDAEQIIQIVKWVQPTFGGINLEDISKPKCFKVLDTLRADPEMKIPVWHDDQQGTACVTLAGLINALKIVGKKKSEVKVAYIGSGSANVAIERILLSAGYNAKNMIFTDSKGILSLDRKDLSGYKEDLAKTTNGEGLTGGIAEANH